LLHHLEQRALRLWRGSIDFIGEHELREHRPTVEMKTLCFRLVDRNAEYVRRQQIARELNTLEIESEHVRQHVGEGGLADAGEVLDQQVSAREQTGEGEAYLVIFAKHYLRGAKANVIDQAVCVKVRALNRM